MATDVIVINGGSSAGKSSIAAELQRVLPDLWLALGIDTFIAALPARLSGGAAGIRFETDGTIGIGDSFTRLETGWMQGIAAMARSGANVIVDDGFLSGPPAQQRWRSALVGLRVVWVGVRCSPEVAAARERARGDRQRGMAEQQAHLVHRGISYDVEVDTTRLSPAEAVLPILDHLKKCG